MTMATPTARSANLPPHAFGRGERSLRAIPGGGGPGGPGVVAPASRGGAEGADGAHGACEAPRREPAWLADLTERIDRSVEAIERMVARVGTLREDNSYLRTVTVDLREALEAERAEAGRRLVEQGRSISQQKRRTAEAERSADALAGMLCDLERQLSGRRADDGPAARRHATHEGTFREGERFRRAG